jgi:excinuclease ABC subunit A
MDDLRKLFTETKEAKLRGYQVGIFSFNVKGGRCEDCEGGGMKLIEMDFLPFFPKDL